MLHCQAYLSTTNGKLFEDMSYLSLYLALGVLTVFAEKVSNCYEQTLLKKKKKLICFEVIINS